MSKFVGYERCPECASVGRDSRGDNLGTWSDGSKHCFSCGFHDHPRGFTLHHEGFVDHGAKSILPRDFTRQVPTTAWKWLLQYGLPYSYWTPYCGYSPSEGRLVFTVGIPVEFSIGRFVEESNSEHPPRKWYVWGDSHKHCEVIEAAGDKGPIVLVEDIVSAHKVGQVTTAIPLFGTMIHPCHKYYLMNEKRPIKIWLDKDQEHSVKKKAINLQMLVGANVDVVVTDKDPKSYSIGQIKELI